MKNIFICNIGNRDLFLDGMQIKPSRLEGKKILDDYDKFEDRLTTPILSPLFEYILRWSKKLEYVTLFVTNQLPPNNNDTLYFGKIIKRLFEKKKNIEEIKLIEISYNPSLYDEMFEFYSKKLNYKVDEWEQVFISPAGGIPACNFALLFNAIKIFQERCEVLYPSEKTQKVIPLHIVTPLLNEFRKKVVQTLLEEYNYSAVSDVLKKNNEWKLAYLLSEYARLRLYFDFDSALRVNEELIKIANAETRKFSEQLREDLDKFVQKDKKALISELFNNARIKAERKEYVDFLGRIFRLQEALLRYVIELELNIPTNVSSSEKKDRYKEAIKGQKENFLKTQTVGGLPLKYDEPSIQVYMKLLYFLVEHMGKIVYKKFLEEITKTQKLIKLRNYSIMAHGFEGVSEKDFKKKDYSAEEIIEDFSEILKELDIEISEPTIFHRINKVIKENL